ncbi:SdpA family antimicrobial peptide system protein [Streptomyces sp. NPDC059164]|uniref:SdpA family antimicrobial peptide system protein n=1 Tax=unclassified Streptomyces TaxID=2593676 RepID=UPI0036941004
MPEEVRRVAAGKGEPPGNQEPPGNSGMGKLLIAVIAFWTLVGGYVLHTQLPSNAVQLPGQAGMERTVRVVTPQGWAFFTKSPRDAKIEVWTRDSGGKWNDALLAPHSEARNAFGFNRTSRAQGVELGQLQARVSPSAWKTCDDGDLARCLSAFGDPIAAKAPVPRPLLCGAVGVTQQEVLPWAWSDSEGDMKMPGKVAVLEVAC